MHALCFGDCGNCRIFCLFSKTDVALSSGREFRSKIFICYADVDYVMYKITYFIGMGALDLVLGNSPCEILIVGVEYYVN